MGLKPCARLAVTDYSLLCRDLRRFFHGKFYAGRANARNAWLVDSGANIVVVSEGDSSIVEILDEAKLETAQGTVNTKHAMIRTPFGVVRGTVSRGTPRLLPWYYFVQNRTPIRWENDVHNAKLLVNGVCHMEFPVIAGTPIFPDCSIEHLTHDSVLRDIVVKSDPHQSNGCTRTVKAGNDERLIGSCLAQGSVRRQRRRRLGKKRREQYRKRVKELSEKVNTDDHPDRVGRQEGGSKCSRVTLPDRGDGSGSKMSNESSTYTIEGAPPSGEDGVVVTNVDSHVDVSLSPVRERRCMSSVIGYDGPPSPQEGSNLLINLNTKNNSCTDDRDRSPNDVTSRIDACGHSSINSRTVNDSCIVLDGSHQSHGDIADRIDVCGYSSMDSPTVNNLCTVSDGTHQPPNNITGRSDVSIPQRVRKIPLPPCCAPPEPTPTSTYGCTSSTMTISNTKDNVAVAQSQHYHDTNYNSDAEMKAGYRTKNQTSCRSNTDGDLVPAIEILRLPASQLRGLASINVVDGEDDMEARSMNTSVPDMHSNDFYAGALCVKSTMYYAARPAKKRDVKMGFDEHVLGCHFPKRSDCTVCQEAKATRAPLTLGHGSGTQPEDGRELFLLDFHGTLPKSSRGDRWMLVLRWVKANGNKPFFTRAVDTRNGPRLLQALHEMRTEFDILDEPFDIFCDNEASFKGQDAAEYLRKYNGRWKLGIPYRSESKGAVEAAVRIATEGVRCILREAGAPFKMWHHAVNCFWVLHNWTHYNMKLRQNITPHRIPFGTLGITRLPKETSGRRLRTRGVPISMLEYDIHTTRGIRVAFWDPEEKTLRKTTIDEYGVDWKSQSAFEYEVRELKEKQYLSSAFTYQDRLEVTDVRDDNDSDHTIVEKDADEHVDIDVAHINDDNVVEQDVVDNDSDIGDSGTTHELIQCDKCLKWRTIPQETLQELLHIHKDDPVECSYWGDKCSDPVEQAVLDSIEEAEGDAGRPHANRSFYDQHRSMKRRLRKRRPYALYVNRIKRKKGQAINSVLRRLYDSEAYRQLEEEILEHRCEENIEDTLFHAHVTRKATTAERNSEQGEQCRKDEVEKLVKLGTLGECYSERTARKEFPNATISGVHLLTSIKFAEREAQHHKFKGRGVLLGDYIRRLSDNKQVYPNAGSAGIFGPVTSLSAARAVFSRALIHADYRCETVDMTNAYIQATWPEELDSHFLKLPADFIKHLPEDYKKKMTGIDDPVFRMERCLYGHPLSGHIWITTLIDFLKSRGWKSLPDDPALMQRGSSWLCAYVDDLAAAGPPSELKQLWSELGDRFQIGAHEELKDFLGMRVRYGLDGDFRICEIDMSDYTRMIVEEYEKLFKKKVIPKYTTITDELRHESEVTEPKRDVQKIVGMLLWLSRCSRPDIALAVSRLGSRVARWDLKCDLQMLNLMGYLKSHTACSLVMKMHKDDRAPDLQTQIYTDANLPTTGKAQSGFILMLDSERGSRIPISWASKKQPITSDSTTMSEMIAAHTGVRETLTLACALDMDRHCCGSSFDGEQVVPIPVILRSDNNGVVLNSKKGTSESLGVLAKALRLRISLLKDLVNLGLISVKYVGTKDNPADLYTKVFGRLDLNRLSQTNGVIDKPTYDNAQ